ncbi:hypothetical protein CAPTEDRAFT_186563 [Capitella teleta]|uniref:Uncharacterized protein n=1 Tax=Capitella teleta TaxID=283909 RepID=R7U7G6_CAPTE|nr:hypothetical protein CAPTEDRAFT_186563 [Capitella teleta]|eukprot:ELT99616.1 hypothetical protein CAPTEDRAFT_186563 [Capitella teleta]
MTSLPGHVYLRNQYFFTTRDIDLFSLKANAFVNQSYLAQCRMGSTPLQKWKADSAFKFCLCLSLSSSVDMDDRCHEGQLQVKTPNNRRYAVPGKKSSKLTKDLSRSAEEVNIVHRIEWSIIDVEEK